MLGSEVISAMQLILLRHKLLTIKLLEIQDLGKPYHGCANVKSVFVIFSHS